ncbi:MAG: hypothetical protein LKI77_02075 [Bifidobacterium sp.]|nr:hypothetical protein [Bifidobacterium sp.]
MSKLENYSNIYADLAQGAYIDRPKGKSFPYSQLTGAQKSQLNSGNSASFFFPGARDASGADASKVFLQPDLKVKAANGSSKSVMVDSNTGYQSYLVTDASKLSDSTHAYLAVRGSDNPKTAANAYYNLRTDWIANDGAFALNNTVIPQAKDVETAMKTAVARLPKTVKLDVTGHSLGTMDSAQGLGLLLKNDPQAFNRIGKVVLWDGPDTTQSLKNMGLTQAQIREVSSKITYYVNPMDVVSMLNRTAPKDEQLGHVNYMVPLNFNSTLDMTDSAHDFGEFQLDENGNPLTASVSFHPELLRAGQQVAQLIQTSLKKLKETYGLDKSTAIAVLISMLSGGFNITADKLAKKGVHLTYDQLKTIFSTFCTDYMTIISQARVAAEQWDKTAIPKFQQEIKTATGSKRVALRSELVDTVAQDVVLQAQDYVRNVTSTLSQAKEDVKQQVNRGQQAAYDIGQHLSSWEIEELLANFQFNNFWDEHVEAETLHTASTFQKNMEQFSDTLLKVSANIEQTDREGADGFNSMLGDVKKSWGK